MLSPWRRVRGRCSAASATFPLVCLPRGGYPALAGPDHRRPCLVFGYVLVEAEAEQKREIEANNNVMATNVELFSIVYYLAERAASIPLRAFSGGSRGPVCQWQRHGPRHQLFRADRVGGKVRRNMGGCVRQHHQTNAGLESRAPLGTALASDLLVAENDLAPWHSQHDQPLPVTSVEWCDAHAHARGRQCTHACAPVSVGCGAPRAHAHPPPPPSE